MFDVYAVRLKNGTKHRHYIESVETLDEAKHICNCCTSGNADYAYAKDRGTTVFFLKKPDDYYLEADLDHTVRPLQATP